MKDQTTLHEAIEGTIYANDGQTCIKMTADGIMYVNEVKTISNLFPMHNTIDELAQSIQNNEAILKKEEQVDPIQIISFYDAAMLKGFFDKILKLESSNHVSNKVNELIKDAVLEIKEQAEKLILWYWKEKNKPVLIFPDDVIAEHLKHGCRKKLENQIGDGIEDLYNCVEKSNKNGNYIIHPETEEVIRIGESELRDCDCE